MKLFCKIAIVLIASCMAVSCNGSKNLADSETTPAETTIPCSENGKSDGEFFRASANATSSSISLSREKAIAAAKSELAKTIINRVLIASKQYANETGHPDKATFIKDMELVANKAIDQSLIGISPICENYSETNGRYTTYIAVEIGKDAIINKICSLATKQISNFDTEKFKNIFTE